MFHHAALRRDPLRALPGIFALVLLAFPAAALAIDTDLDGLDDATEVTLGTDPNLPDTDGDRFSDGGEVLVLATDPLVVDEHCEWPGHDVNEFGLDGYDLWLADVDHDGDLDVLELMSAAGSRVWENDGVGPFTRRIVAPNHGPDRREFVRNIDFDLDGDEDVLVGEWDSVILYENLGGWQFAFPGIVLLEDAFVPRTPSVVDMDLDGDLDIVVSTNDYDDAPNLLWLIRNRGNGTFAPGVVLDEYTSPNMSWVADIDKDGWPDIVGWEADHLFWYRNPGTGQPQGGPQLIGRGWDVDLPSYNENTLEVVDLDGDGWMDFTFANRQGDLSFIWNLGPDGFSPEQEFVVAEGLSESLRVWPIDMDVDGDLDVAVSRDGPARDVGWLENRGGRLFEAYEPIIDYDYDPYVLVGGDFDLDGDEDLVTNAEDGWRENIGVGDVDGDGLDARDEVCYVGSDAHDPDTDDGGVMDGVELQVGRDPLESLDDGDADADGIPTPLDCDDLDPEAFPGAPEQCATGVDEDCDGLVDEECFELSSPVPGLAGVPNTFTVTGASDGSTVHLVLGLNAGTTPVPGCPGLVVEMGNLKLLGAEVVDAGGQATFTVPVPPGASGRTGRFQAVDLARCEVTNLVVHTFP